MTSLLITNLCQTKHRNFLSAQISVTCTADHIQLNGIIVNQNSLIQFMDDLVENVDVSLIR